MGHIVKATEDHAHALAGLLRPADVAEIDALTGNAPLPVLLDMARYCDAWAMFSAAGELAGMCGVDPVHGRGGQVWMLGSEVLERRQVEFLRASRAWVAAQGGRFQVLFNLVDARNTRHIVWLRWLGFTVSDTPIPAGARGLPFLPFYKDMQPCASPHSPS